MESEIDKILEVKKIQSSSRLDAAVNPVIRDISFNLCKRETHMITGESGSGGQLLWIGGARALVLHSKYIIANQFISALDVSIRYVQCAGIVYGSRHLRSSKDHACRSYL